jgi:hypothetical protein
MQTPKQTKREQMKQSRAQAGIIASAANVVRFARETLTDSEAIERETARAITTARSEYGDGWTEHEAEAAIMFMATAERQAA